MDATATLPRASTNGGRDGSMSVSPKACADLPAYLVLGPGRHGVGSRHTGFFQSRFVAVQKGFYFESYVNSPGWFCKSSHGS